MKKASYDIVTGKITAWYDFDFMKTSVVEPSVDVSDEIWQKHLNNEINHYDVKTKIFSTKDFRTNDVIITDSKKQKLCEIKKELQDELSYLPVTTLDNSKVMLANTPQDQTNSLLAISTSQQVLQSPKHKANTNYKKFDTVNLNGVIMLCLKAGKSGKTKPTPPIEFQTRVNDGSVKWVLFGQLLGLHPTGIQFFTPQDVLFLAGQSNLYITGLRQKYAKLKEELSKVKTKDNIEEIKW